MRNRILLALYYSAWPVLIGWNPTNFCNRYYRAEIDGRSYNPFGGYRWNTVYNAITDEPNTSAQESISTEA